MLLANWTNTKPIVPIVVVPVHVAGIEVHVPRVVRVVRVERTRPVVAVAACVVERTVVAVACCWKQRESRGGRYCVSGTILFKAKGMLHASQLPHLYAIPAKCFVMVQG